MDHARFKTLKEEITAHATVEQLVELEAETARLLSGRVSDALIAKRSADLAGDRKCPRCGGDKIVRHGRDHGGRQRFRCLKTDGENGCGRTFNALTGTAFARMRKPELWMRYAAHLAQGTSLTRIIAAGDVPINRLTAWRWRHRLLAALALPDPGRLSGVVEADEAFLLRSFKGHRGWKRGQAPENRPPRYRGSGALLPGLSHQHVPVVTAIDRTGKHADAVLQGRTKDQIVAALDSSIEPDSILCTDNLAAYGALAEKIGAEHRMFDPPETDWLKKAVGHAPRRKGALGLGRVNSHHEAMKTLVNRNLRGVSTKYLPNYLVMLRLERRPPTSPKATLQTAFASG